MRPVRFTRRGSRAGGIALGLILAAGCTSIRETPDAVRELVEGPERWLMTSEERRELGVLGSRAEVDAWHEAFWARRHADPEAGPNLSRATFERRVDDADRIYREPGLRGALTARGRVLILLGPPSVLRRGQRAAPRWSGSATESVAVRTILAEEWVYPPQRLPTSLVDRLAARGETEFLLRFVEEKGVLRLVEGEADLRIAAEAWIVDPTITPVKRVPTGFGRAVGPNREPKG